MREQRSRYSSSLRICIGTKRGTLTSRYPSAKGGTGRKEQVRYQGSANYVYVFRAQRRQDTPPCFFGTARDAAGREGGDKRAFALQKTDVGSTAARFWTAIDKQRGRLGEVALEGRNGDYCPSTWPSKHDGSWSRASAAGRKSRHRRAYGRRCRSVLLNKSHADTLR